MFGLISLHFVWVLLVQAKRIKGRKGRREEKEEKGS